MLEYLLKFGVDSGIDPESIALNYEIDITDITLLESQINNSRKVHYNLIKLNDRLQDQYLIKKSQLSRKIREINEKHSSRAERTDAMDKDVEYLDLTESIAAIDDALKTIGKKIDFVKSDIRILSNSMYRKL